MLDNTSYANVWDAFSDIPRNGSIAQVDHGDNNKLNNNFNNLQLLNCRDNSAKGKIKNDGRLTGASLMKNNNRWRSRIEIHGITHYLGVFDTMIEAHNRYNQARAELIKQ